MLEDLFLENAKETVLTYEKRNMEKIEKFISNDNFNIVSGQGLGTDVRVTSSVVSFYNLLVKFSNDICLLSKLQVCTFFLAIVDIYINSSYTLFIIISCMLLSSIVYAI